MQDGKYQDIPATPFTLGLESAGIVSSLGDAVDGVRIGDRVAIFAGHGGLAEQGVFDAARVLPLPDMMSFEHAAAFQIAYSASTGAIQGYVEKKRRRFTKSYGGRVNITDFRLETESGTETGEFVRCVRMTRSVPAKTVEPKCLVSSSCCDSRKSIALDTTSECSVLDCCV